MKSPAFQAHGAIPVRFTGEGDDVAPPLRWGDIPHGTRELAEGTIEGVPGRNPSGHTR